LSTEVAGNAAKAYCMRWLERLAVQRGSRTLTVLDLGCGTAQLFLPLLRQLPQIRYTGVEPSGAACDAARTYLAGCDARIVQQFAYTYAEEPSDVVISFSVMEHVYDRRAYLRCAAANVKDDGVVLLNYDSGHFLPGAGWRDRLKTTAGSLLARVGVERYYQSFLRGSEFRTLAADAGLRIIDEKLFNLPVKALFPRVPPERHAEFLERWLDFELYLNQLGLREDDTLSEVFMTRNFVLQRASPALHTITER
jgi:SAM-dependent methyltransferase